jgi:hypothetical protein
MLARASTLMSYVKLPVVTTADDAGICNVTSGKLLLVLVSTVILGSESRGTNDHISPFHDSGYQCVHWTSVLTTVRIIVSLLGNAHCCCCLVSTVSFA